MFPVCFRKFADNIFKELWENIGKCKKILGKCFPRTGPMFSLFFEGPYTGTISEARSLQKR